MTERRHEIALTPWEVDEILRQCGREALLVGGQALAFWASYFDIAPIGEFSRGITSDADFIGTATVARKLGRALNWKVWLPSMDDATAQTAKVTRLIPGGGVKQVDFLSGIVGLDTARIQERAVEVELASGAVVRILHPLDVLESRLRNLEALPSKRDAAGIAQAGLAVAIAGKFMGNLLHSSEKGRRVLDAVERIASLALDRKLVGVAVEFGIDVLAAVPALQIKNPGFRTKRWPQIMEQVAELRRKHAPRGARRLPMRKPRSSG